MSISRHQAVGAYRRWEPPAFGETEEPQADAPPPEAAPAAPEPAAEAAPMPEPPPAPQPEIQLPTAAEIEAMFDEARREGHEAGFAEGAELARQQAGRLAGLADGLDDALKRLDQDVAEEIVALAIEVARQMVRRTLAENPEEAVIETVRAALSQLPQAQVRIHVHPDDVALVRTYLADQPTHLHHHLLEDDTMTRGGCRLQSPASEIDATVETRWRRILEGLGHRDAHWEAAK
ncbi:flagellar assembly protein FliH [Aromatoleum toluvorans]|uniref:Flagellar assembly protein FliH n=1 Tax=Aromatoleum toluvorans TaxID=92002 RepID=A0ABX1Q551_9RHOO|nr:flagellar assembly protein FliH [Aromatoleum toluvorans]NMG45896.1 flagellar assembly protein FliH [Aromatoleum toluvorans]